MRIWTTAFSCGVILLYSIGVIPPLMELVGGIVVLFFMCCVATSKTFSRLALFGSCCLAGMAWAAWLAGERLSQQVPGSLEGVPIQVTGFLCDIPSSGNFNSVRFSLCVTGWPGLESGDNATQPSARGVPSRIQLAWYGDEATLDLPHLLLLTVKLKRPHGSVNPAGFRYETWLYRQGYRATGTVKQLSGVEGAGCGLRCHYHQWRNYCYQLLHQHLSESEYAAFAEALLMGYRGGIRSEQWQVLQDTGTIHLMAISGLHLGLIAMAIGVLTRFLLLRLPVSWLPPSRHRLLVAWVVVLVCLGYSLLAGFTVPTRRALVMVTVACWMLVSRRQASPWTGWLIALFLVLLMDPFSPLDRGFWLSFGAVAVLILVFSRWYGRCHWLVALVLAQVAVSVGLWPILAALGQPQVTMGMPANLVAIPWVSFLVMPVLLIGGALIAIVPALAAILIPAMDLVLGGLWQYLSWLAEQSSPLPAEGTVVPLAVALLVLLPMVIPVRAARFLAVSVAVFWGIAGVARMSHEQRTNSFVEIPDIWVWDVGQGLSVLVRHRDQVLLYDTGPEFPGGYSAVKSVLLPNLARLGIHHIDTLVLSHGDSDHVGGLRDLLVKLPVGRIVAGEPDRVQARLGDSLAPAIMPCANQPGWQVGGVSVTPWQHRTLVDATANERSCVLVLRYSGAELVLPGDIPESVEDEFLSEVTPEPANYRIVVAPHHGSKSSSGIDWVQALNPELVLFSAGYRHRFGHPHPTVVARYRQAGSMMINTATSGAVAISLVPSGPVLEITRQNVPFWIQAYPEVSPDH